MEILKGLNHLEGWLTALPAWLWTHVLVAETLVQVALLLVTWVLARLVAPRVRAGLEGLRRLPWLEKREELVTNGLAAVIRPLAWLALLGLALVASEQLGWPGYLLRIAASLVAAWVVIRFSTLFVRDPVWAKAIAYTAWIIAALNVLHLLEPTVGLLDRLALRVGQLRISALLVLQGVLSLVVFLWLAVLLSQVMERRIRTVPTLTPSIQVLISKLLRIVLITVAIVTALGMVGIDLTAFAVFTGAVGVGVGFGLQKVVSNLISGVILLLDKSVKPGDVISVGETFGWINSLGARYVSVVTRDGREYLIPNEDLITQQVVNWSYSNNEVRLHLPIGVSYRADVRLAMRLCLEAAAEHPRVLRTPESNCLLRAFGDSAVELELRLWINDPKNGLANVQSDLLLAIWDRFHTHGIEIPFPQRDLHLVSPSPLTVRMAAPESERPEPPAEEP